MNKRIQWDNWKRESVSGSYRIDSETAIRPAAAPRASSEIRQGSCPLCGDRHATENDSYGMPRLSGRTRQLLAPLLARIGITPPPYSFGRRRSPCHQNHVRGKAQRDVACQIQKGYRCMLISGGYRIKRIADSPQTWGGGNGTSQLHAHP